MTVFPTPTPVALINHVDALLPGTRLAEFEVLGLVGVGGFGMVYQAFDHSLRRPVAIKEYMPCALACRGEGNQVVVRDAAETPAFQTGLQSFVTEARLLAQFDHPSLVKVFRYWEDHQTAYMVMPMYRGITLQAARSQMRSPPTEAWLRKVLWAILGALKTLHQGRAVHRDVSPDNIFLQDVGPPVLLDLGSARHAIGGKTEDLTDALKLSYAPLEQHAGAPDMRQGPWTDLYALAAVVHGLLCNKPPLPATFRAVRDRLTPVARVARTVNEQFGLAYSAAFIKAIDQALAIDSRDRPQTVLAMVQAMGLETPNGMSRFDWRAELGEIWTPPGARSQASAKPLAEAPSSESPATIADDSTQPLTVPGRLHEPAPAKPFVAAAAKTSSSPVSRRATPGRMSLPWRVAAGVTALAVLAVPAALLMGRGGKAAADARPAVAASPAPAVEPVAIVAVVPTSLPAPALVPAEPQAAPAPAVMAVVAPVPSAPLAPAVPPAVPAKRAVLSKKSTPANAGIQPTPAASPAVSAAPEPVVVQAAVRPKPPDPRAQCADSNFVTRPMCIFKECQKPDMAGLAVCVENNARLQNSKRPEGF